MSRNNKTSTDVRDLESRNLENKNRVVRNPSKSPENNIKLNKKL